MSGLRPRRRFVRVVRGGPVQCPRAPREAGVWGG